MSMNVRGCLDPDDIVPYLQYPVPGTCILKDNRPGTICISLRYTQNNSLCVDFYSSFPNSNNINKKSTRYIFVIFLSFESLYEIIMEMTFKGFKDYIYLNYLSYYFYRWLLLIPK